MILNNNPHSILVSICEYILKNGDTNLEDLKSEMLISVEDKDKEKFTQTLNKWTTINLFNNNKDVIALSHLALKYFEQSKSNNIAFVIRRIIFETENNQNFWAADGEPNVGASDLVRGCAWYLAQDVLNPPPLNWKELSVFMIKQCKKTILQNDTRLSPIRDYMAFLGFMWGSGNTLVVDPTLAILQDIPYIMETNEKLSIKVFIERLAKYIPVLDEGAYRKNVENELNTDQWKSNENNTLSHSLEWAMSRLQLSKKIELSKADDSPSYNFRLFEEEQYSHIKFLGK